MFSIGGNAGPLNDLWLNFLQRHATLMLFAKYSRKMAGITETVQILTHFARGRVRPLLSIHMVSLFYFNDKILTAAITFKSVAWEESKVKCFFEFYQLKDNSPHERCTKGLFSTE